MDFSSYLISEQQEKYLIERGYIPEREVQRPESVELVNCVRILEESITTYTELDKDFDGRSSGGRFLMHQIRMDLNGTESYNCVGLGDRFRTNRKAAPIMPHYIDYWRNCSFEIQSRAFYDVYCALPKPTPQELDYLRIRSKRRKDILAQRLKDVKDDRRKKANWLYSEIAKLREEISRHKMDYYIDPLTRLRVERKKGFINDPNWLKTEKYLTRKLCAAKMHERLQLEEHGFIKDPDYTIWLHGKIISS